MKVFWLKSLEFRDMDFPRGGFCAVNQDAVLRAVSIWGDQVVVSEGRDGMRRETETGALKDTYSHLGAKGGAQVRSSPGVQTSQVCVDPGITKPNFYDTP